jgi:RimJ/RimL family protein N-acetyltransferase
MITGHSSFGTLFRTSGRSSRAGPVRATEGPQNRRVECEPRSADAYCSPMLYVSHPLRTPRMTLRQFETGDLGALHDLFRREDVCRYLRWEPMDLDHARAKLEQRLRETRIESDGDALMFAAAEDATGRVVGELMLRLESAASRQGEVGWSFHPDVQGRGLATEGAREMLRLGFDELGLHRIAAEGDPRNIASVRVMEKVGMRREALFVENEFLKGEWVGEIVCAILEDEWRAVR